MNINIWLVFPNLVGSLMDAMVCTCLSIAYVVSVISGLMSTLEEHIGKLLSGSFGT